MRAFIENEIRMTQLKIDGLNSNVESNSLKHGCYSLAKEYTHWINAYEALLESLPEDKVLVPKAELEGLCFALRNPDFMQTMGCTSNLFKDLTLIEGIMLIANTREVSDEL